MRLLHGLTALVFAVPCAARPDVVIDVPSRISMFETTVIRVSGLPPLQPVAIRATTLDGRGKAFVGQARFRPALDGTVDTGRSIANGGYEGVDAMGLFWSAQGEGAFEPPLSGTITSRIDVEDAQGKVLASATIDREVVPAGVTITKLGPPEVPFVGNLYQHAGPRRAVVVTLTGSNGGIDRRMAPWVASQGYDVLSLGYYHGEGLPENLFDLPLEYFLGALQWLERQAPGRKIALFGGSKGAEAALLIAAYFPAHVRAVVALMPAHVVWEGIDARARFGGDSRFASPRRSSWSLNGKPLPFVSRTVSASRMANPWRGASLDAYAPALTAGVDPAALIPVERIRGGVFVVSGGDDLAWPSLAMAREIKKRKRDVQLCEYPAIGHGFFAPGLPTNVMLGGTMSGNAKASADGWPRLRKFLREELGHQNETPPGLADRSGVGGWRW